MDSTSIFLKAGFVCLLLFCLFVVAHLLLSMFFVTILFSIVCHLFWLFLIAHLLISMFFVTILFGIVCHLFAVIFVASFFPRFFQTPEVCTDSGIGLTEPESKSSEAATFSPFSSSNEKPQDDIADFEDAMDPSLLTSTLKAEEEDSDDEFGFDLPGSKSDNGKSVIFSGGDNNIRENEATKPEESIKEADKTEVTESPGQTGTSVAAAPVLNVDKIISAQPVTAEAKIEAAPPQPDVIKVDEVSL